jgi:hypothetical protein
MKKIAFLFLSVLCVNILVAQAPPTITSGKWWNGNDSYGGGISLSGGDAFQLGITTRSTPNPEAERAAPIAPATLLLLGLGGAAVGTTVLKNTRKK